MRAIKVLLAILVLSAFTLQEAEELFLRNKPEEARPLLESALNEDPDNENIYLYLGIVYEQLGETERAIKILKRGLEVAGRHKDLMYYNIGNNLFRQEEYTLAVEMYSNALEQNGRLAEAFLNRANARLELEQFNEAREDYIRYLELAPDAPQRAKIEEIIRLLGQIMKEAELKRQEEQNRQQALLNEVLNTLENASEDTRNLSAGSEEIEEEYEEIDIAD